MKLFLKTYFEVITLLILTLAVVLQRLPVSGGNHLYAVATLMFIYWCHQNGTEVKARLKGKAVSNVLKVYGLFTICFIPSILCSDLISHSFQEYFNIFIRPFFPFVMAVLLIRTKSIIEKLWLVVLLFVVADAGMGLYQYFVLKVGNGYGFSNHYLSLSGYLVCIAPVVVVWALDKDFSKYFRICAIIGAIILLLCAFSASRSRALWCILLALLPVILLCYRKTLIDHKLMLILPIIGVLLVGCFFVSSDKNMARLKSFSNTTTNGSNMERLMMWNSARMMMKDFPLTGVGVDNYASYYQKIYETKAIWTKGYGHPHSSYFLVGAEAGIPGFLAIVGSTVAIILMSLYRWWKTKNVYFYLLLVSWLGFSIFGLIEPLIIYSAHTMFMSFFSGCCLACSSLNMTERE